MIDIKYPNPPLAYDLLRDRNLLLLTIVSPSIRMPLHKINVHYAGNMPGWEEEMQVLVPNGPG